MVQRDLETEFLAKPKYKVLRSLSSPHNHPWENGNPPESLLRMECCLRGSKPLAAYAAKDHLAAASADRLSTVIRLQHPRTKN